MVATKDQLKQHKDVYVIDGARTPFIKARGKPGPFTAGDLAVSAGRPLLLRQSFVPDDLSEVILGCVMPGPNEVNIARVASLRLGIGKKVPAFTVQRNCASGMQALATAANNIALGHSSLVLAGGVEAMSHAPLLLNEKMVTWLADFGRAKGAQKLLALTKLRPAMLKPVIGLLKGLTDHNVGLSMGATAEIIAHRFGVTREEMDSFSMDSHMKLAKAQEEGSITEIEAMYDGFGNFYEHDNGLRKETTMETLAKLRPAFDKTFGSVTAGNSAQITDGAAWLILASSDAVKKHNLEPIARIVDCQWSGVDPAQMGLGPTHAMADLFKRQNLQTEDIDYWEINEAFATQVLAVLRAWDDEEYCKNELGLEKPFAPIPTDSLNVNGGAVCTGHPVGASGARIVLRLVNLLKQKKAKRAVASLCIGGGQGGAMLIERD
ncbi:3-ketoacyl-CoA thiolase @ Acetyl-CoA acetyltransferase [hydrothermal vent metagenome]|uniref:3-ketoacyl-CoA thiolase @ Acetyl-CoA acetyltransferase n=1 Tax=hydrothermal vent metagenome TaxID=652676 RepID=A0A3B1BUC0_9ZZZZ